ncbi:hypothetical protein CHLRE_13g591501v5 [Chlamydomonas reinhardtii]|uniref:Pseudouridine synthase I TruA alpha/beta domain-containing protein n=1 Tax=Chlamydomonas reinhardtii TaxID=3055 RepID=A0A2K3D160_CHLRE|nr:uncharacterized protein CHLRE_13g591501v5 [Chlamydomonas reinhardtii]PNW74257.1 hypothetical protein CHLRE_13g591501v5 [Chlamydomonas reinhardtii]
MLRCGRGCLRQACGRGRSGAARSTPVLRGSLCVQWRGHGPVPSLAAAAGVPAIHRVQQCSKHHSHGRVGPLAVRREDRCQLALGRVLHPGGVGAHHTGSAAASGNSSSSSSGRCCRASTAAAAAATAGREACWSGRNSVGDGWPQSRQVRVAADSSCGCSSSAASSSGSSSSSRHGGAVGSSTRQQQGRGQWVAARGSSTAAAPAAATATAGGSPPADAAAAATSPSPPPVVSPATSAQAAISFSRETAEGLGRLGKLSYRLILAYDGTDYCGWQLQPAAPTVQAKLEAALGTVLREDRGVLGVRAAGRTDSGVHARGQVVQFNCDRELPVDKLAYKLNAVLPPDIRVMGVRRTAPDFSVTCSPIGKTYHYNITNSEAHDPLRHRYAYHVRKPLDLAGMRAAAALLVGTHDFTQFSNIGEEGGRPRKRNPVKTLRRMDVVELDPAAFPGGVRIEVEGNGFLYKMVRHISGVLVAVGERKLPPGIVSEMLEVGDNAPPGRHGTYRGYNVAPARGLTLHEVMYDPRVDDPTVLLYPELRHDEHGRLLESIPDALRSDEE